MARYDSLPLYERVPDYYMHSPPTAAIIRALTDRALAIRDSMMDAAEQFNVHSATWGLALWEELTGLTPAAGADEQTRRGNIMVRLRGSGTCNAAMISSIAEAITGYGAVVVEHFSEYTFSLILVGDTPGFADIDRQAIIDAVEEVKPAHLKFVIESITWRDFMSMLYTWQMVEDQRLTWRDIETKVMVQRREDISP